MLDRSMLKQLGVTLVREALCILKQAKETDSQTTYTKAPAAKFPQLNPEMTPQQFRKFQIDWDVFAPLMHMPRSQANIHLYNCDDEAVQNAMINTHPNFLTTDPDKLLDMAEALVIQRSNSIVHRLAFASMPQNKNEQIQNYLVHLRDIALDCNFTCPSCEYDLSDIYIKDRVIRGIASDTLQADLLAKAGMLKFLGQNACHAEAFESGLRNQTSMASTSDIAIARMSTYRRRTNTSQANKGNIRTNTYPNYNDSNAKPRHQACVGCGSHQRSVSGTGSR